MNLKSIIRSLSEHLIPLNLSLFLRRCNIDSQTLYWGWSEQYRAEWMPSLQAVLASCMQGNFLSFLNQPQQATRSSSWPTVSSGSQIHSPRRVLLTEDDKYLHETFPEIYLSAVCWSLFTLVWLTSVGCGRAYVFCSALLCSQRTRQPFRVCSWHQHLPFVNILHAAKTQLALELVWREQKRLCGTAPGWIL